MDTTFADFTQLLRLARSQPQPQRLLFVFVKAGLPENSTAQQKAEYAAGVGGELEPLMATDKVADELDGFGVLVAEAASFGPPWDLVFVSSLSGSDAGQPEDDAVAAALDEMIERVRVGRFEGLLPFDAKGRIVEISS